MTYPYDDRIRYSLINDKCEDRYMRHVTIPERLIERVPTKRTMTEAEWRSLGIEMESDWVHFLRPCGTPDNMLKTCHKRMVFFEKMKHEPNSNE